MSIRHGGCPVMNEDIIHQYYLLINQFSPDYEGISGHDINEFFTVQIWALHELKLEHDE